MNGQRFSNKILLSFLLLIFLTLTGCDSIEGLTDDIFPHHDDPDKATISGMVKGDVKEGVMITLSGDDSDTTVTDQDGNYSFHLKSGNYYLTPSLTGYTFYPISLNIIVDEESWSFHYGYDFTATLVQGGVSDDVDAPTAPTNLIATAISSSQVNLSWDASVDNKGVVGYRIYRNGFYLKSVTGVTTSDTALSSSTTYCYIVFAYDAANNESQQSTQVCATTM